METDIVQTADATGRLLCFTATPVRLIEKFGYLELQNSKLNIIP
jgi:hypothetical protein